MKKNYIKISLIINIIIVNMVIFASFVMFSGIKFMPGKDLLESSNIGMFKFFTVDSNMFMGIIALLFLIEEIKLLKGSISSISKTMYLLKFMSTVSVSITFLVVFVYLGPISEGGIYSMLVNSNLFFHLLIPVFSILSFIFFEKNKVIKFKDVYLGILPTILYGTYYLINILVHMENGKIDVLYDWYWFVQTSIWSAFIVIPIMLLMSYIISLLLWKFNKE